MSRTLGLLLLVALLAGGCGVRNLLFYWQCFGCACSVAFKFRIYDVLCNAVAL